ncbi:tetratricopeptide repeat domain protein [Verrucomicrobiia bacterium DG1235]|nr:tetratricopeptide repeat domain protein [Verrucomicrobiae bacterium DG1235]
MVPNNMTDSPKPDPTQEPSPEAKPVDDASASTKEAKADTPAAKPSFFAELKRRKVVRVAITYAIVAWLIVQIAAATFPGFEIPMWAFRFVVLMLILGFPVALLLAWAFELTPDGIKLTKNVSEGQKAATSQGKRNWLSYGFAAALPTLIFGALALYFYFTRSVVDPSSEVFEKSIAVLPFDNRSNVDEDQFFTDGIHDDLLTQISRIRDIKTISRTSVMAYKDTTKNMRQIGEELGVATLLEGGVQRSGDQIRINMQLIDASKDKHIWAETYTREMSARNVFAIQSEITDAVAAALRSVLSPEEQEHLKEAPTENLEALEAFFEGRKELNKRTAESILQAIVHFRRAVELDSSFARAYAQWAICELLLIFHAGRSPEEQVAKTESLIESAFGLDTRLEDSYVALGMQERYRGGSRMATALAFEKAVELNPNNIDVYAEYAPFLIWDMGRPEDAVELLEKAYRIDPKNAQVQGNLADALRLSSQSEEALELLSDVIRENPDQSHLHHVLGVIYIDSFQDYPNAIESLRTAHSLNPLNPNILSSLAQVYASVGDLDSTVYWLDRIVRKHPRYEDVEFCRLKRDALSGDMQAALDTYRLNYTIGNQLFAGCSMVSNWDEDPSDKAWALEQIEGPIEFIVDEDQRLLPLVWALEASVLYASALRANGLHEEARSIQSAILEYLSERDEKKTSWAVTAPMLAYALAGETQIALAELRGYVESGGAVLLTAEKGLVSIYSDLLYEELKDESEFQELVAIMNERIAAQRAEIERMEANGELAPIPKMDDL